MPYNSEKTPKDALTSFENNKLFLSKWLQKFSLKFNTLSHLIEEMAEDDSMYRFELCEAFRIFGNTDVKYGGGEGDIQALCQAVTTGYVYNGGRVPKDVTLSKISQMIIENDIISFLLRCQSIYRAAKENEFIEFNSYISYYEPSYSQDPWEMIDRDEEDEDDDYDSAAVFEEMERAKAVKAGNKHKRYRPLNNTEVETSIEVVEVEVAGQTVVTIPIHTYIPSNNPNFKPNVFTRTTNEIVNDRGKVDIPLCRSDQYPKLSNTG